MKQRVITGIVFLIVMLAIIIPAYWVPLIAVGLALIIGSVSTHEMIKAMKSGGIKPASKMIVLGELIALAIVLIGNFVIKDVFVTTTIFGVVMLSYCLGLAIIPQIISPEDKLFFDLSSVCTVLYISFPLYCLCATALYFENGWFYLVVGIGASWVSDTLAYFTGVLFGKHKIVPHISPKKTWEGCIGGAFFCALVLMFYFGYVVYDIDGISINRWAFMAAMFVFGILFSAMSQIGDWLASSVKRAVGIKDYGNFMPGHGGMLDRFDSVFFTLPIAFIIALVSTWLKG